MLDLEFIVKKHQINTLFFLDKTNNKYLKLNINFLGFKQEKNDFLFRLQKLISYVNDEQTQYAKNIKKTLMFFDIIIYNLCIINNYLLFTQHKLNEINLMQNMLIVNELFLSQFVNEKNKNTNINISEIYNTFCHDKNLLLMLLAKESISLLKKKVNKSVTINEIIYNLKKTDQHEIFYMLYQNMITYIEKKLSNQTKNLQENTTILNINFLEFIRDILLNHLENKISYITNFLHNLDSRISILNLVYEIIDRCCIYIFIIDNNICNLTKQEFFIKRKKYLYTNLLLKNNGLKALNSVEYLFSFTYINLDKTTKISFNKCFNNDLTNLNMEMIKKKKNYIQKFLDDFEIYFLNEFISYIFELTTENI